MNARPEAYNISAGVRLFSTMTMEFGLCVATTGMCFPTPFRVPRGMLSLNRQRREEEELQIITVTKTPIENT